MEKVFLCAGAVSFTEREGTPASDLPRLKRDCDGFRRLTDAGLDDVWIAPDDENLSRLSRKGLFKHCETKLCPEMNGSAAATLKRLAKTIAKTVSVTMLMPLLCVVQKAEQYDHFPRCVLARRSISPVPARTLWPPLSFNALETIASVAINRTAIEAASCSGRTSCCLPCKLIQSSSRYDRRTRSCNELG